MNPLQALRDYIDSRKYGGEDYTLLSRDDRTKHVPFPAGAGGQGSWGGDPWSSLFGSNFGFRTSADKINFAYEIGDLRLSSLIVAAIRWVGRNLNSARLNVVTVDSKGKETEIQNHEITRLWHRPNKLYSGSTLNSGIAASWIMDATAYVLKIKGRMRGPTVELWWEPSYSIRPRWANGNPSVPIEYYEVYRNGAWWRVELEDVIVFRDGYDPDTRKGMNTISGLLSEIYTDKQLAALTGMLVKNGLVPAIAIGLGDGKTPFKGDVKDVKAELMRRMGTAEPFVGAGPVRVEKMGYDLSDYGIKEMRETPEQRFCAGIGISPISLMLGAGINVSTYSNVKQYLEYDYRNYIVSLHDQMADQLEVDLLPEYGEAEGRVQIVWDYRKAPLMQKDKAVEWRLYFDGFQKRVFNRAQALEGCDMEFKPEDNDVYYPVASTQTTVSPLDEPVVAPEPFGGDGATDDTGEQPEDVDEATDDEAKKALGLSGKDLDEGAQFWADNAPDEARELMAAGTNGKTKYRWDPKTQSYLEKIG